MPRRAGMRRCARAVEGFVELSFLRTGLPVVAIVAALCFGPACIQPVTLSAAGRRVLVLRYHHHREHMVWLGRVWCWVTFEGYGFDANAMACEYDLMNQAAKLGGTVVVVEEMRVDDDSAEMVGAAYIEWPPERDRSVSP